MRVGGGGMEEGGREGWEDEQEDMWDRAEERVANMEGERKSAKKWPAVC